MPVFSGPGLAQPNEAAGAFALHGSVRPTLRTGPMAGSGDLTERCLERGGRFGIVTEAPSSDGSAGYRMSEILGCESDHGGLAHRVANPRRKLRRPGLIDLALR